MSSPLRRLLAAVGALALLWLPSVMAKSIKPSIPGADRSDSSKVFLEQADFLEMDEKVADYQILRGDVVFRKQGMWMYCDSAHFWEETGSLDAFGNVRMEQGDTLFVYGSELQYDGPTEIARLFGEGLIPAKMINRDVELTSDIFEYDMSNEVGYYLTGGKMTDKKNRLTSLQGEYYPETKDAYFYHDVILMSPRDNDTIWIYTDSLLYNTETRIATILTFTRIVNKDGEIRSTKGTYNTDTEYADLRNRSLVVTRRGNTLTGDTLIYDRKAGLGHAYGDVVMTDSARQIELIGDIGFYNEVSDSAFVTGEALAKEYSRPDTLYIHGDSINAYRLPDSTRVTNAFHKVRFFSKDYQGLCDSLSIVEADSVMFMYRHPILWSGTRQVHGNEIWVHSNDSTADWARLPAFGMTTEHIGAECFDQLAGTDMTVWFNDSTINRLYVEGNVQMIMFPMENDSTYNKFTFVETSYMDAWFKDQNIDRVIMWPETTGNVTPLYLAKRNAMYLPDFQWYGNLRPLSPDAVFVRPREMLDLMASPEVGGRRTKSGSRPEVGPGKPSRNEPQAQSEMPMPMPPTEETTETATEPAVEPEEQPVNPESNDE